MLKKGVKMAKDMVKIEIPEEVTHRLLCEDADDFMYFLVGFGRAVNEGAFQNVGSEIISTGFKMLLAEYLAGIAAGDIKPYRFDNISDDGNLVTLFRYTILNMKQMAMKSGVPMKEVNGKIKIDVDQMIKNGDISDSFVNH